MSAKQVTKSDIKKCCVSFSILTAISLGLALCSSDLVRIMFSVFTLAIGVFSYRLWNLWKLPDDQFALKIEEIQNRKTRPSRPNETTEFNLYHSPNAVFSPHNDN